MIAVATLSLILSCDPAAGSGQTRRQAVERFMSATADADAAALDGLLSYSAVLRTSDGSLVLPKDILVAAASSQGPQDMGEIRLHTFTDVGARTAVVADFDGEESQLIVFGLDAHCIAEVVVFI